MVAYPGGPSHPHKWGQMTLERKGGQSRVGSQSTSVILVRTPPGRRVNLGREGIPPGRYGRWGRAAAQGVRGGMLVLALPDPVLTGNVAEIARTLNPRVEPVFRTHSDDEAALLREERLGEVFTGEHELAAAMARHVVERQRQVTS